MLPDNIQGEERKELEEKWKGLLVPLLLNVALVALKADEGRVGAEEALKATTRVLGMQISDADRGESRTPSTTQKSSYFGMKSDFTLSHLFPQRKHCTAKVLPISPSKRTMRPNSSSSRLAH